jgi:hypothetical protein
VLVGNGGLTTAVASEIDRSLTAHELIKVRILGNDRNAREVILQRICDELLAGTGTAHRQDPRRVSAQTRCATETIRQNPAKTTAPAEA